MDFDIILASPEDGDRVYKFLCEQYYLDEPLGAAAGRIPPIDKEHCGPVEFLTQGLSVLAVKKDDPSFVCGAFLNKEVKRNEKDVQRVHLIAGNRGSVYEQILIFLDYNETRFHQKLQKYWDETQTNNAMDLTIIGVHKDFRQRGLASRMMEKSIAVAKDRGFQLLTIECTSAFSTALALKHGFINIYHLPYEDYKDENGQTKFHLKDPHLNFNCLLKLID